MPLLPVEDRELLLRLSRNTLKAAVEGDADPVLTQFSSTLPATSAVRNPRPCFVTLKQLSGRLRGCIGWVSNENRPLYEAVYELTQHAAFADPRFSPVKAPEVDKLQIEISVLGPLVRLENLSQVKIGTHGLYVRHGKRSGLLLAQVAVEQEWNTDEFIKQTCVKAGLSPELWQSYECFFFEQIEFGETTL